MMLRLAMHGGTGPGDPIRVMQPTYGTVGVDPIAGTIVVDVPDDHLPPGLLADAGTVTKDTVYGKAIVGMGAPMVAAWKAKLVALHPNLPYAVDTTLV